MEKTSTLWEQRMLKVGVELHREETVMELEWSRSAGKGGQFWGILLACVKFLCVCWKGYSNNQVE